MTLPYDAALSEPRTATSAGGVNTGWYEGYDYLYSKTIAPDEAPAGKCAVLKFEGVYHNAEVWLNGRRTIVQGACIFGSRPSPTPYARC